MTRTLARTESSVEAWRLRAWLALASLTLVLMLVCPVRAQSLDSSLASAADAIAKSDSKALSQAPDRKTGGNVLAELREDQSGWVTTGDNYNLVDSRLSAQGLFTAYVGDSSWENYVVEFDVKQLESSDYQLSVLVRRQSETDYIGLQLHSGDNTGSRWVIAKQGKLINLVNSAINHKAAGHYRIEIEGDKYTLFKDGSQMFMFNNNNIANGGVGLKSLRDGLTFTIENFRVMATAVEASAATEVPIGRDGAEEPEEPATAAAPKPGVAEAPPPGEPEEGVNTALTAPGGVIEATSQGSPATRTPKNENSAEKPLAAVAPGAAAMAEQVLPLDCEQGKVCREPKTLLPARVLTRAFSFIYKDKNTDSVLSDKVAAFSPLYVFAREDLDFSDPHDINGWYQIGVSATGSPLGWMQAKDVVEWRQALVLAFTHPGVGEEARRSVIFFNSEEVLDGLTKLDDSARKARAEELYQAIQAAMEKRAETPDGVITVEPGPFVDIQEQFYMLPILQFEDLGARFVDEARHVQVIAVAQSRAEAGEPQLPQQVITDASGAAPTLSDAVKNLGIDVVFVMDMTASMVPFIKNATESISDVARLITQDPGLAKEVRFGFVGYRDDIQQMPYLDFTAKNYTPDGTLEVGRFLQVMDTVNQEMERFAESELGSGDYEEEVYAGVKEALQTQWSSDPSIRFIVLVGDASSHEVGHPQNTTGLNADALRQQLNANQVQLLALHLQEDRAAPDHPVAQAQFSTLASNPGVGQAIYYPVPAMDMDAYTQKVKTIASTITESIANLRKGNIQAVAQAAGPSSTGAAGEPSGQSSSSTSGAAAGPSSASASSESGSVDELRTGVAKLVYAATLPYLGKEEKPPRDFLAWAFDRDLINPMKEALQVRVLLTREQVNDLVHAGESVSQAFKTAELTQMGFFESLQSIAVAGSKGQEIDYEKAQALRGSGLVPSWLESLPYKSAILSLNDDYYAGMSPDERAKIENDLDAKVELYRNLLANADIWIKPSEDSPEEEKFYPLELASLP